MHGRHAPVILMRENHGAAGRRRGEAIRMKNRLDERQKIEMARVRERKRIRELLVMLSKHTRNESTIYSSEVVVPLVEWRAFLEKI